jgi:hypothetical protein
LPATELNEHEQSLKQQLEQYRSLKRDGHILSEFAYCGVEDFLLQHGEWQRPTQPLALPRGAPKSCFGNALYLAATLGYRYIEGMAIPDISVPIAMHHGWNLTRDGVLVDNTWMNTGLAYLGVEFSVGRADNAMWFDDGCVLDNPRSRFKIYREPWTGENFNLVWRKSKHVRQLKRLRLGHA